MTSNWSSGFHIDENGIIYVAGSSWNNNFKWQIDYKDKKLKFNQTEGKIVSLGDAFKNLNITGNGVLISNQSNYSNPNNNTDILKILYKPVHNKLSNSNYMVFDIQGVKDFNLASYPFNIKDKTKICKKNYSDCEENELSQEEDLCTYKFNPFLLYEDK